MTDTDICNLALDMLKEAPITALSDDRPIARWLSRNYPVARDSLLKRHDWNFALKRASLAADGVAPAFGWHFAYTLPSDNLRVIHLTADGRSEGSPVLFEVEDGKILTNEPAPLPIRYVFRQTNTALYSPEFVQLVAARLAMGMAHWLTGKSGYVQIAQQAYERALADAWALDAIEGSAPRAADDEWIDAR